MLYYCFYETWALLEPGTERALTDLRQKITQIWHFVKQRRDAVNSSQQQSLFEYKETCWKAQHCDIRVSWTISHGQNKKKNDKNEVLGCIPDQPWIHWRIIVQSDWTTVFTKAHQRQSQDSLGRKNVQSSRGVCLYEYILSSLSSQTGRIITGWTHALAAPAFIIMQQSTQV